MEQLTISDAVNGINFVWSPSGRTKNILHNKIGAISLSYDASQGDYKIDVPVCEKEFSFFFKSVTSPICATPQALVDIIRVWGEKIEPAPAFTNNNSNSANVVLTSSGDNIITFTTAFADANWYFSGTPVCLDSTGSPVADIMSKISSITATGFTVNIGDTGTLSYLAIHV